jgi:hypothetical protein
VVYHSADGKTRIRTRGVIAIDRMGKSEAVCQRCGAAVPVDLVAGDGLRREIERPLVVAADRKKSS